MLPIQLKIMIYTDIDKVKDGSGESVAINWRGITHNQMHKLRQITMTEEFKHLIQNPYGLAFGTKGEIHSDSIDVAIMVSCEEHDVPQDLLEMVINHITYHYNLI